MAKMIIDIPDNMQEMCKWHKEGICDLTNIEIYILVEAIIKGTQFSGKEWIPVKYRESTEEEKAYQMEYYGDCYDYIFDCLMPDDGQEILITVKRGDGYVVYPDTCILDLGYYLEKNNDWDDVIAWMPLPEPYKEVENADSN